MYNVNRVTLLGYATSAPFVRKKEKTTHFFLATRRKLPQTKQEEIEVHVIVVTGHLGEFAAKKIETDSPLYLEGRLRTEDGETVVIADRLVLLTKPNQLATAE